MLITTTGELIGLLGGGCFERDLVEHAAAVFETGTVKTLFYDMRSGVDAIWSLVVTVRLSYCCNGYFNVWENIPLSFMAGTHAQRACSQAIE
ncbi:XdhC family protein [Methylomonas fluvii]|uniref:XdhC family protein n=1 Tax=Methylomonas fluvii TaxID=1854564 RepID=UPI001CE0DBAB|nr:XdhC family protein [Methylomonas fluvii]